MNAPTYAEPVEFWGVLQPEDNGMGGFTGTPERLHRQLGEVKPLRSKREEMGAAVAIKQQYLITFWRNPAYEPQAGHTVLWRGEKLTIQSVDYVDVTRQKYRLIGLEQ